MQTQFAGRSMAQAYFRQRRISLGLSLIPLWRARLSIALMPEQSALESAYIGS